MSEFHLEDGRLAERKVTTDGEKTVTEVFVEPIREKKLQSRVVEYTKPCVIRREIEALNEAGEIVSRTIEDVAGAPRMELREHLVSSLSVQEPEEDGCYATKEDLKEAFLLMASSLKGGSVSGLSVKPEELNMQSFVGDRLKALETPLWTNVVWGIAAVVAAIFVYVVFFV